MFLEVSIFGVFGFVAWLSFTSLVIAFVFVLRNRLKKIEGKLTIDPGTGVQNRQSLIDEYQARHAAGEDLYVMLVEVTNLADLNNTKGLEFGDISLRKAAQHLREFLPERGTLGRVSGNTFCIIGSALADGQALTIAQNIFSRPALVQQGSPESFKLELSIGLAVRLDRCANSGELFRKAERALLEAKKLKEGPVLFDERFDQEARVREEVRNELSNALKSGQLKLHYQPIFDARSAEVAGYEALMRWPEKIGPAGSPGVFIPIAEETGLIVELGLWSLRSVLEELKHQPHVPISLNVSARQLLEPNFAQTVADEIISAGINPILLKLELTETVLIEHTEIVGRILRQLRDIGVQLALDDFGTGYSSLSYLQKFKFDFLKIDRAFVREINNGPEGRKLLSAIINMGHSLNMKVVAEGVETAEQAALLQLLKSDLLQGYFLGVPMPMEKLVNFKLSEPATTALIKKQA